MGTLLERQQFDDRVCFILACSDYPLMARPSQVTLAIGRRIGGSAETRTIVSSGTLGSASGVQGGARVDRRWSSTTVASLLAVHLTPQLRLGAGPVLGWIRSEDGVKGNPTGTDAGTTLFRPGLLMEAGWRSSATKRVFLDLSVSYRLLGGRMEGPFPVEGFLPDPDKHLPAFRANFNTFTLGVGLGVRF